MPTPKHQLLNKTLSTGWTLVEKLDISKGQTGGNFGVGYRATMGDKTAFVKAVDFVKAMNEPDPILKMQELTNEALFEREVLEFCASKGMTKVIRFIGHEYYPPSAPGVDPMTRVSCLIMEAGEKDLRRLVYSSGLSTCAWNMQVLRDVSQALAQLHRGNIAHGDIKPSNIIATNSATTEMKVGDLGRVIRGDKQGPFDALRWPGDRNYRPPEMWYGNIPGALSTGWSNTRESPDAYTLGSLLVYLFTGASLQSLVIKELPEPYKPGNWTGNYDDNLIAVLIDAHYKVLNNQLLPRVDHEMADAIMKIAKDLTHPNPIKRGDARARSEIRKLVGIDRIYQKFEYLALSCAAKEKMQRLKT